MTVFTIDPFDIVKSRFERDLDHMKLQVYGLYWFSRSGVRLHIHWGAAENLITGITSHISSNFVVNTS